MTRTEVINHLRYEVAVSGSQLLVARALGVSPQYLNDVLRNRRDIGNKILKSLGLIKVITYVKETNEAK